MHDLENLLQAIRITDDKSGSKISCLPLAILEAQETRSAVLTAIQTLPETQRLATILFYDQVFVKIVASTR